MKNVIGLDLGSKNIKLVNLALIGKEVELLKFDIVEMPKTSNQYEIIDLLKTVFKNNKLKPNIPVCLSISAEESFFKIIPVKSKGVKKLKETIKDELRKNVVFSLEDCLWDYHVLGHKPKDAISEVLLVAAKNEAVSGKVELIEQAGANPFLINLDMLSIYNCLKFNTDILTGKLYALVDISSIKTQVFIFDDRANFWARTIVFGGSRFTDAIIKKLGISQEEAEEYKKNTSLQKTKIAEEREPLIPLMKEMSTELDRAFNYYYFQASESATKAGIGHKIDEILLSGGGSLYPGLDKFLTDNLGIPVRYIYPLQKISIRDKAVLSNKDMLNIQSPQLAAAIGLGLEGLKLTDIKINLIKKAKTNIFKRVKANYIYNLISIFCGILLIFLITAVIILAREKQAVLSKLKEFKTISQEYIPKITVLKEKYDGICLKADSMNAALNNRNIISRILYKISEIIPQDVWITNFTAKFDYQNNTGQITLNGKSLNYKEINKLISGLKDTGYFSLIKPMSSKTKVEEVTKEELVNFIIKLVLAEKT